MTFRWGVLGLFLSFLAYFRQDYTPSKKLWLVLLCYFVLLAMLILSYFGENMQTSRFCRTWVVHNVHWACFLWLGRNSSVDRHNRTELAKLQEFEVVTDAKDLITTWEQSNHVTDNCMSSLFDEKQHRLQYDRLKKHSYWEKCRAAKQIHLRIGAQVM